MANKKPNDEFRGKIARSYEESEEWWPEPVRPHPEAPNVIIFLLDDVGFAQMSRRFGGLIDTPNIDRLADNGLRYNDFHTTALCSPTRAALLTGRNHHSVGFSAIAEMASGPPVSLPARRTASIGRLPLIMTVTARCRTLPVCVSTLVTMSSYFVSDQ